MYNVKKYDEEVFTTLFDVVNKIDVKKISIGLTRRLCRSQNEMKNIRELICSKISALKTENMISNNVSLFILHY